jgi:soluble lytic murein transglycosylase-like protein
VLAKQIADTATAYGLDPLLVLEVMRQESAFNPRAGSGKGARGLMQLMPATAARFQITNALDPQQAITGGCRYLRYLSDLFGPGNTALILAAYNAGEGAVTKYGNRVPPYPETVNYVNSIGAAYARALALRDAVATRRGGRVAPRPQVTRFDASGARVRDAEVLSVPLGTARRLATSRPQAGPRP